MNTTRTATWTLKSGKTVTATATLIATETINADGHVLEVACTPRIVESLTVEGIGAQFGGLRTMSAREIAKYPGHSHVCGKLAMTTEQANMVAALTADLESTAVWQAHLANVAKVAAEAASYDAHRANMSKVMGY